MKPELNIIRSLSLEQMLMQFHLIQQLNPNLKEEHFRQMLPEMIHSNYKMLGVFHAEKCIAISGYWVQTKIYSGKYLEPDNVVVDESYRSMGIGEIMLIELEKIAVENQCRFMMLDAYLENTRAHLFYENLGFQKKGYHMLKKLNA